MSSQAGRIPPLDVREVTACMCAHGDECTSFAPGHALHLIQSRLASATPSDWRDAIVEHVDEETGIVVVHALDDGDTVTLWNRAGAAGATAPGDPVALHARYSVLAAGRQWFNVRR
ncbi:MAG: hypothetical protein QM611_02525 [Microbacterium sp.]|uniref:hypothetical protein n=1 Tax=Microbacterium sp. TaxID=51671 RepID=UPI0039E4A2BA